MENMKMIDELFERAREEKPRLSFDMASKAFFTSVLALGGFLAIKQLIISKIGLNSVIMISTTAIISTALIVSSLSSDGPLPEPLNNIVLVTDTVAPKTLSTEIYVEEKTLFLSQREIPLFEEKFDSNLELKPLSKAEIVRTTLPLTTNASSKPDLIIIEQENLGPAINKATAATPKCTKSFCIRFNDDMAELECIQKNLKKLGLDVQMDPEFNRDDVLEMLKLRIQHENGLDLKLKVAGFTTFALMCIQDENGELIALKYKTDDSDYSEVNMFSKTSYTYMKSVD